MATDQYGRPLPDGTVARLGTVRPGREGDRVSAVCFTPDGKALATGGEDGIVRLWDVASSRELRRFGEHPKKVDSVAFAPDGKTLVSTSHDGTFASWDVGSGRELRSFQGPAAALALNFAPDGKSFLAVLIDDTLRTFDLASGNELSNLPSPFHGLSAIAFAPDGKTVGTGSWESMIRICEFPGGKEIKQLQGHKRGVQAMAFATDGRTLASGSPDETIRIWELLTTKERLQWSGFKEGVLALAFSPDGKMLASAVNDTTVLIWDVTCRPPKTPGRAAVTLMPSHIEAMWTELASNDVPTAFHAVWNVACAGRLATPLLKNKLKMLVPVDRQRITNILADINHEQYGRRDKAVQDLEKVGALCEPLIQQALKNPPSMDARRRLEKLLEKINGPLPSPDTLHVLRAIEALELANTAESRQILDTIAKETPPTRVSLDAKASLARLAKRPVTS